MKHSEYLRESRTQLGSPQPDAAPRGPEDGLREALRRLVGSAVLVPMAAEDDDDEPRWFRAALASPAPETAAPGLRAAAKAYFDNLSDEAKRHAYWCEAQNGAPCNCGFGPFRDAIEGAS